MPLILGTNSIKDTGFDVANSLRFDDGSSDNLSGTLSSGSGSDVKGTISLWVKRCHLGTDQAIICGKKSNSERVTVSFTSENRFEIQFIDTSNAYNWRSTALFRDTASWYNCIIKFDTGNGTATSRVRAFINNEEITSWSMQETIPNDLKIGFFNGTDGNTRVIGARGGSSTDKFFDGYIAEVVGINNSLNDNTDFGEVDEDSGIWKPIDVSDLTFGTNGFYLDFESSGALGTDSSGNGNNFTVNNLTSIDQSIDTCTNNFATMNNLLLSVASLNFTDANLTNNGNSSSHWRTMYSTIPVLAGKWYFEIRINKTKTSDPNNFIIGIQDIGQVFQAANTAEISSTSRGYGYRGNGGNKVNNTTGSGSSYGDSYGSIGDIIGCAVDLDNHKIYFRKNGTYQNSGDPTSGATGTGSAFDLATGVTYVFGISSYYDDDRHSFNFGSPPYSESGGNSDGNGYGNFAGSVPSGYYSLNTKNLAQYG